MSQTGSSHNRSSRRMDKLFYPILLVTGIIYFTIFFITINISTVGPDRDLIRKENIKRAVRFITKQDIKSVELDTPTEDTKVELQQEDKVEEEISETVDKDLKKSEQTQLNKKTEKQRRIDKERRKQRREQIKAKREREAKRAATARIQKIQAISKGLKTGSSSKYSDFKGTTGSGNFADALKKSGTLGSGTGGGSLSGVGKSDGSVNYAGGSLDDFFSSSDFGEISTVEGLENVQVSELKVEEKEEDSGRNNSKINRYIESKIKSFDRCVKVARASYKTLTGAVTIKFTITKSGRVRKISIVKSQWSNSKGGKKVEKCIKGKIKSWRFGKADGDITISKAFSFL